jgi:hypothetical protein
MHGEGARGGGGAGGTEWKRRGESSLEKGKRWGTLYPLRCSWSLPTVGRVYKTVS